MNIPKLTLPRWPKGERAQKPVVEGAPLAWCLLLTAVGVAALVGSTWMLLVFVAGSVGHVDWAFSYRATEQGVQESKWHYEASIHLLVGIGLFLFCLSIAMFNATWLETRKHLSGLIRTVVTSIGVAVALFMISGAIVVQQRGTDARARDEVVAAQTAQVGAATAGAQLEQARQTLREMRNHPNQYMAVAATVGAAEFERSYLSAEQRRKETPDRVRLLERSLGAARRADALEADIARLTAGAAQAQTQAVVAEAVSVRADGFMAGPVMFLEDARKPITAVLGELLALTAFSFALAAWQSRRAAQPAEDAMPIMIEDHSAEAVPVAQPYAQATEKREQFFDEDGNKIVRRRATFARVPTRKLKTKVGGKKDETDYEAPAKHVSLNVENEDGLRAAGEAEQDAGVVASQGGPDTVPADAPEPARGSDIGGNEIGTEPAPQAVAEMEDEGPVLPKSFRVEAERLDAGDSAAQHMASLDEGARSEENWPADQGLVAEADEAAVRDETDAKPIILPDERIDELIERGVLVEDEDGIRAVSQEDQASIEQPDQTYNYPRLPAPKEDVAA